MTVRRCKRHDVRRHVGVLASRRSGHLQMDNGKRSFYTFISLNVCLTYAMPFVGFSPAFCYNQLAITMEIPGLFLQMTFAFKIDLMIGGVVDGVSRLYALRWIKSYLSERSQFVRIGTASSKPTVVLRSSSRIGPWTNPFRRCIRNRWRKLPMHTELYSNTMPMTRNDTLLCRRYRQQMLSYNCKTVLPLCINGCRNGLALNPDNRKQFYFRRLSAPMDFLQFQPLMQLELQLLCPARESSLA